jgi:hypothetical protein
VKTAAELQQDIDRLAATITHRWGETRRFHTNAHKIDRLNRLIERLVDAKVRERRMVKGA